MRALRETLKRLGHAELSDEYLCLGLCSLFLGAWCIYPPAGLLVIGVAFTLLSYATAGTGEHGAA